MPLSNLSLIVFVFNIGKQPKILLDKWDDLYDLYNYESVWKVIIICYQPLSLKFEMDMQFQKRKKSFLGPYSALIIDMFLTWPWFFNLIPTTPRHMLQINQYVIIKEPVADE